MKFDIGDRVTVDGAIGTIDSIYKGRADGRDPQNWRYNIKLDKPQHGVEFLDCGVDELQLPH